MDFLEIALGTVALLAFWALTTWGANKMFKAHHLSLRRAYGSAVVGEVRMFYWPSIFGPLGIVIAAFTIANDFMNGI